MKKRMIKLLSLVLVSMLLCSVFSGCKQNSQPSQPEQNTSQAASQAVATQPAVTQAAGQTSAPEASKEIEVLTVGLESDIRNLDPAQTTDLYSASVYTQIHDKLFDLDINNNIVPVLAEYKQIDDTTYEFYIKKGVKFHNGDELKASDVVYTLKRGAASGAVAHSFDAIDVDNTVVKDDYTVLVKLKAPSAPFIIKLTGHAACVVNEKVMEAAGEDYSQNPVGTGPMKFVSWDKNVECVVERFDDYHGERSQVKKIVYRPIVELTSRAIELESGAVDIVCGIPPTDLKRIEDNSDLQLLTTVGNSFRYIGFNTSVAPFDNPKVRRALAHAIDTEGITRTIRTPYEEVSIGPYASTMMYYDSSIDGIHYDPVLAKQLLTEAGYPDGFSTRIIADERKERVDIATIVQQQLDEIGVTVNIEVQEFGSFLETIYAADTDMYVMGWTVGVPDPDYVVSNTFHSSHAGDGGGNMSFVVDPKFDDLIERGEKTTDPVERQKIYSELQAYYIEQSPWVMLWTETIYLGVTDKIDIQLSPSGIHQYATAKYK